MEKTTSVFQEGIFTKGKEKKRKEKEYGGNVFCHFL